MIIKAAVIAGTPVDTRMGVEFIESKNEAAGADASCVGKRASAACGMCGPDGYKDVTVETMYLPVSSDCDEQVRFQYSSEEDKHRRMDEIFGEAMAEGVEDFFIYCNSLSGAFDFDSYAIEKNVRIYTPLQIYRELGRSYNRVGVIAANNLSAYNIEKNLIEANSDIYVIGSGNMAVVSAIEKKLAPAEIIEKCGLVDFARYIEACGCEAMLLGCTHFPYLKEALRPYCRVPLIDPADMMYEKMITDEA